MSSFPTLTEMGIKNPNQIARYTLHEWNRTDHLRIVYDRQKGSLLPASRKYKFAQLRKSVVVDSGTRQMATIFESTGVLNSAITELDQIVGRKHSVEGLKAVLLEEITHLEEEVNERIAYIKTMVEDLK
jgi:hypothetical protein